jgi:putative NADPH-quinone reductase
MVVSIILAHPKSGSFNHAIAKRANATLRELGHEVRFHDLHSERFDPVLPAEELPSEAPQPELVAQHCREIAEAEGIVVVHPNWWGQPPAILTGWIDRVLRAGVAYRFLEGDSGEGVPVGLLRARSAIVLNTSNTPPEREERVFGDPLEAIWRSCIFGLCGVSRVERRTFSVVVTSTAEQRARWLADVGEMISRHFPRAG